MEGIIQRSRRVHRDRTGKGALRMSTDSSDDVFPANRRELGCDMGNRVHPCIRVQAGVRREP
jgi:hypothetical protein